MQRVSVLIEVDGIEKQRFAMTPEQVKRFDVTGDIAFAVLGFKNSDGHGFASFQAASLNDQKFQRNA